MNIANTILEKSREFDSFYIYSQEIIQKQINILKRDFNGIDFLYSVKANPAKMVVRTILDNGFGADAASLNEAMLAHNMGIPKEKILYSAPGKLQKDIEKAIDISTVIADSINEIRMIDAIAREKDCETTIGVRINPNFTFISDKGEPSKFGIDEEEIVEYIKTSLPLQNVKIAGIHVHVKSQELNTELLAHYYENMFELACRFKDLLGDELEFVNLGSGIGIPYSNDDLPVDTAFLGEIVSALRGRYSRQLGNVRFIIETGRFVVGKSGYYVSKVVDRKISRGTTYIILNSTLNGFVRPCLEMMISHYEPEINFGGYEPFVTGKGSFKFVALTEETRTETVTIVGNLCTSTDMIAENVVMPVLYPGDIILMTNAGSYAAVITPMQFASQEPAQQLFLKSDGCVCSAID